MLTLTIYFIALNVSVEFVLIYRPHPVCTFKERLSLVFLCTNNMYCFFWYFWMCAVGKNLKLLIFMVLEYKLLLASMKLLTNSDNAYTSYNFLPRHWWIFPLCTSLNWMQGKYPTLCKCHRRLSVALLRVKILKGL